MPELNHRRYRRAHLAHRAVCPASHRCWEKAVAENTKVCQLQWPHAKDCEPSTALLERLLRKTALQLGHSTRIWVDQQRLNMQGRRIACVVRERREPMAQSA